jgi:hypothetical protein
MMQALRFPAAWAIVAAFVVYLLLGTTAIGEPGLYMDEVNPDYLVVHMANPDSQTGYWLPPGNMLFGRLPVLLGLYSGAYPAYTTYPFYRLLGGSIVSLRLAHLALGLAVLIGAAFLLLHATRSPPIAGFALVAMATDPAFLLPLRTQATIAGAPVCLTLAALAVLTVRRTWLGYLIAGFLLGLSVFGYFVFLFPIAGIALFVLFETSSAQRWRRIGCFAGGLAAGALPYAVGYGAIAGTLGVHDGIAWVHATLGTLHVSSGESYFERAWSVLRMMWLVCTGDWNWTTFWQTHHADGGQIAKVLVLIALPLAALPYVRRSGDLGRAFAMVGLATASFVLCATWFGSRLGGHDLVAILPLLYVLAAIAAAVLAAQTARRATATAALAAAAAFVLFNVLATGATIAKLSHDGGSGLYSDVISRYPQTALARHDATPHVFWDWGGMFQFVYLTEGTIPASDASQLTPLLCQYGAVKIVTLGADANGSSVPFTRLGLKPGAVEMLRDVRSEFPYRIVTVTPLHGRCPIAKLPPGTRFPAGVVGKDLSRVEGIFPEEPQTCCALGPSAAFDVSIPTGASQLAFTFYMPKVPHAEEQRVTVRIDGQTAATSAALAVERPVTLDVPIPASSRTAHIARVEILPSFSFVPKDVGIDQNSNRLSVVFTRVRALP